MLSRFVRRNLMNKNPMIMQRSFGGGGNVLRPAVEGGRIKVSE